MKLSIIVPVYNMGTGKHLEYCLDSLLNQTVRDYEIIAVNDASTDDTKDCLEQYEKKYPERFRVITHSENKRQGGARNTGIEASKGDWIGFIDSDDWITPDFYEKLIDKGEKTGADVVGCFYSIVHEYTFEPGVVVKSNTPMQTGEIDEAKRKLFINSPGSMVVKVYKRELIMENNLRFPEKMLYEDNGASVFWCMNYKHFELVEEPLYFYYQNEASTTHTITVENCYDRMHALEWMLEKLKETGYFETYKLEIEDYFTRLYFVNTLFSYMLSKKEKGISFVVELKHKMKKYFPDFMKNPYYNIKDEEQRRMINLLMKDRTLTFYVYYSLLWFYRRKIRK